MTELTMRKLFLPSYCMKIITIQSKKFSLKRLYKKFRKITYSVFIDPAIFFHLRVSWFFLTSPGSFYQRKFCSVWILFSFQTLYHDSFYFKMAHAESLVTFTSYHEATFQHLMTFSTQIKKNLLFYFTRETYMLFFICSWRQ